MPRSQELAELLSICAQCPVVIIATPVPYPSLHLQVAVNSESP